MRWLLVKLDYANSLSPTPSWTPLGSVSLTSTSQYCFDVTLLPSGQGFYRACQTGAPSVVPSLDLHLFPAITLTGNIGGSVRVDAINQFGPTDAWFTLDRVRLTNGEATATALPVGADSLTAGRPTLTTRRY